MILEILNMMNMYQVLLLLDLIIANKTRMFLVFIKHPNIRLINVHRIIFSQLLFVSDMGSSRKFKFRVVLPALEVVIEEISIKQRLHEA